MDTQDLESILARRDLAVAEAARDQVGPHAMFLANYYWRTQDWVERSLVVHMVQDQRGPHLRGVFSDFLRAPDQAPEYADHMELAKAVCLAQLRVGTPTPIAGPSPSAPPPQAAVPAGPSDLVWRGRAIVAVLALALLWLLGLEVAARLLH